MAGAFRVRAQNARLNRELLSLFKKAGVPVVLLGSEPPSAEFPCDFVGVNRIGRGRRVRVRFDGRTLKKPPLDLLQHGELIGDVALRLMMLRLGYAASTKGVLDYRRHPPSEVFLDLPESDLRKGKRK